MERLQLPTSNSQAIETTIEEATNHRFLIWDILGMIWDDSGTLRKIGESKLWFFGWLFVIDDSWGTVGSTLMNATSSRAHTVQIIEFKVRDPVARSGNLWSPREFPRCYLQPVQAVTNGSATVSMINLATMIATERDMEGWQLVWKKYGKWWRHSR